MQMQSFRTINRSDGPLFWLNWVLLYCALVRLSFDENCAITGALALLVILFQHNRCAGKMCYSTDTILASVLAEVFPGRH